MLVVVPMRGCQTGCSISVSSVPLLLPLLLLLLPPFVSTSSLALRVGVVHSPPYVNITNVASSSSISSHDLSGFSLTVWRHISQTLSLHSSFKTKKNLKHLLTSLISSQIDVGIVGYSIQSPLPRSLCQDTTGVVPQTWEQESEGLDTVRVCASIPYHRSVIRALAREDKTDTNSVTYVIFLSLIHPTFLTIFFLLITAMILAAHIIWYIERKKNQNMFRQQYIPGTLDGFYWSGITASTIGYGDKFPTSVPGKMFTLLWILVSLTLFNVLLGFLTSQITIQSQTPPKLTLIDLVDLKLAVLPNSVAMALAYSVSSRVVIIDDIKEGVSLVKKKKVDYVLGDQSTLSSFNGTKNEVLLTGEGFHPTVFFFLYSPDFQRKHRRLIQDIDEVIYEYQGTKEYKKKVDHEIPIKEGKEFTHDHFQPYLVATILGSVLVVYLLVFCVVWPTYVKEKQRRGSKVGKEKEKEDDKEVKQTRIL